MNDTKSLGKWSVLSQAPHRLFFASGCFYSLLPVIWWTHWLILRSLGISYPMSLIPREMHLVLMVYGMVTQFILGFILTVFPRWLGTYPVVRKQYLSIFYLMQAGLIGLVIGSLFSRWVVATSAFVLTIGFVLVSHVLWNVLKSASGRDEFLPRATWIALSSAIPGMFAYCLYNIFPEFPLLYRITFAVGVYFFVPLVILTVAYRMVPFFTSTIMPGFEVIRFEWVLTIWSLFSGIKVLLYLFDLPGGYLLTDTVLLFTALYQFRTWAFFKKRPAMLLTYLYHSMFWFPISCLFFILNGLWAIVHGSGNPILELAGIHGLTIGFFGCMIFSMATRVSKGHSGRPLMTDSYENALFYLLQLSVVSRITIELMGLWDVIWIQYTYVSGVLWLLVFLFWTIRYLPIYLVPRLDGQPG